jgi:polyribonucleotide nucleotidyltransferase
LIGRSENGRIEAIAKDLVHMNIQRVSCEFGGKTLFIETGKMAKQADGSVMVGYGDSRVLVTAVSAHEPRPGADFSPPTVK